VPLCPATKAKKKRKKEMEKKSGSTLFEATDLIAFSNT
jgi:hypothetical protein